MDRQDLINFYKDTNYLSASLSIRGIPPRPSEWNVPLFIKKIYPENIALFKESLTNKSIEIQLDQEDINYFKALMLHESLFNFYKAYYNYICALKMYDGGLQHWITITSYYSKLYMANSIIALTGNSRYVVNGSNKNFVEDIYKLVNPKGYNRNIEINGKFIEDYAKYGIEINIAPSSNEGVLKIITDLGSGGSHSYIWNKYSELDTAELGITRMEYDYPQKLSNERNLENYSFDGYKQLDFNLGIENFKDYFKREYIKDQSDLIYTSDTAIILGVIGELYNLYKSLGVKNLPIEKEKLIFMCDYSLGKSNQSIKLIDLIKSGFPPKNKYLNEYNWYEST
ncbi:hypothetical protein [Psychrobacillus sp. NPDC096623]|uniref:hypothetical protein n=1 Tax=Psychrobacillus sp. NPDC096623 TaxID=3364492 RepID=UPI00382EF2B4